MLVTPWACKVRSWLEEGIAVVYIRDMLEEVINGVEQGERSVEQE
jgi:hypothetical protein